MSVGVCRVLRVSGRVPTCRVAGVGLLRGGVGHGGLLHRASPADGSRLHGGGHAVGGQVAALLGHLEETRGQYFENRQNPPNGNNKNIFYYYYLADFFLGH